MRTRTRGRQAILFVGLSTLLLIGSNPAFGRSIAEDLRHKKITIGMTKQPLGKVFQHLIDEYDVPIGLEESQLDIGYWEYHFIVNRKPRPKAQTESTETDSDKSKMRVSVQIWPGFVAKNQFITVNETDVCLEDVLDIIVPQMRNYGWEVNNGVVNIYPTEGRNPEIKKLLDLQIEKFAVREEIEVKKLRPLMYLIPEVKEYLDESGLSGKLPDSTEWYKTQLIPSEIDFTNKTFKELLNEIVSRKRGGWILRTIYLEKHERNYIWIEI